MSGVIKGIGKIFKAVGHVVSGVFHAVGHVVSTLWHIPIIRYAAIAVAAYFTAGAVMGAFSSAGAAGGTAGAIGGASIAPDVGQVGLTGITDIGAGTIAPVAIPSSIAAAGGGTLASTIPTLAAVNVVAPAIPAFTGQSIGASLLQYGAGAVASGIAAGTLPAGAPSDVVNSAVNNASNNLAQTDPGQMSWQDIGSNPVDNTGTNFPFLSNPGTNAGAIPSPVSPVTAPNVASIPNPSPPSTPTPPGGGGNFVQNILTKVGHGIKDVGNFFFGDPNSPYAPIAKMQLLSTGLQVAAGMLWKQPPQMQFAGVNPYGIGPGTQFHTINNGFGLATGSGQQAPTSVPSILRPPGASGTGLSAAGGAALPSTPSLPGAPAAPSGGAGLMGASG